MTNRLDRETCKTCGSPVDAIERRLYTERTGYGQCDDCPPATTEADRPTVFVTEGGRIADLRACVVGNYSASDLAALMLELAHAEAENGLLPTQATADACAQVLAWIDPATGPVLVAGDGEEIDDDDEPERGQVTLTYMRDPRVYCTVDLDGGYVDTVWSCNGDELTAPTADSGLGGGLTLADFNDALAIAESDTWPSWS